ncbi:START domain-containing protein [Agitococcus lubricus]|uniref:START domain-containing protein n=2 Tax=Agitococcus lubricus TaxID=1077255 RepID=A0A2T5J0F1_9GAMM|nr:START domain-containing protein [Agitococcus lubricus]
MKPIVSKMMPRLLFLCCASFFSHALAQADAHLPMTKLAIDKQGIKVWTYKVKNNPVFSYKAATSIYSSITNVSALLLNPNEAPKWAPYVRRIDVLSPTNAAGIAIYRMELDLPFPLTDRDVVIKSQLSYLADGSILLFNEATQDQRAPIQDNMVRVARYQGSWLLKPNTQGYVEITTSGYADLGGAIPASFANLFVEQQPYQMLQSMRSYLRDNRLQS